MADNLQNVGDIHILGYFIICIVYLIFIMNMNKTTETYHVRFFLFSTFCLQLALSMADIYNSPLCSSATDYNKVTIVLLHTIIPWIFILGFGNLLISIFPGWLRIFSNTIGIRWAYSGSAKKFIEENIKITDKSVDNKTEYFSLLNKLFVDPTKLLNEIDITNIKDDEELHNFYQTKLYNIAPEIFKKDGIPPVDNKENTFLSNTTDNSGNLIPIPMNKLEFNILYVLKSKNEIGYAIWNILLGVIAVLISTNSVINSKCDAV
jgi:hypothetical protein